MEREKLICLVTAAQRGDGDALNNLFNEFYNDVYYFALKTVKDEDLACDITQESFVEIINTIGDLKEPAAFVKWMKQITYHQCTRHFKKKKDVLVDEDEEGNSIFDIVAEDRAEFIPDAALDQQDFRNTILAMLDELSEEQRAATLLYYYDELSVKQIAEIQGVSEGTVKSRLNYARKSIKNSVETYEKKNNVKLHSFAFLPFMLWLLRAGAQDSAAVAAGAAPAVAAGVSAATGATITAAAASGTAAAVAAGTTAVAGAGMVAKIAALPLAVKIISVLTAGAIVVGSVGIAVANQQEDPTEPSTSVQLPSSSAPTVPTNPSLPIEPTVPPASDSPKPTEPSVPVTPHVHTYGETVVDATCTEQGYSVFICDCGDSYEDNYVAAQGHSWDDGVTTLEPTENASGERLYHCVICNDTRIETIPVLGHTHRYAEVITNPSCTEQGYTTYTCTCNDSYVGDYIAAIGHGFTEYISNQNATCENDGTKTAACDNGCGEMDTVPDPDSATGHDYVSQVIAPTTESQGYTKHECRNCGHSYEDNFVDQLPTEENPGVYYVPEDSTYIMADGTELAAGEAMPETVINGDRLITPYYTYTCFGDGNGWKAVVNDTTLDKYPELLSEINGVPLVSLSNAFEGCANMTQAPQIPNSVTNMHGTFMFCSSLVEVPEIPNGVVDMSYTFHDCSNLVVAPEIPHSVTSMNSTFDGCISLVVVPEVPNGVTDMSWTFFQCTSLIVAPAIPNSVTNMRYTFMHCYSLTGSIEIHANLEDGMQSIEECFAYTELPIILTGTSTRLNELAATATNGNVTVASSDDTSAVYYVPEGCTYILADGTTLIAGEAMPTISADNDQLITLYYTYTCFTSSTTAQQGWKVQVLDDRLEAYPALLPSINGLPLLSLNKAFFGCHYLVEAPKIPDTVTNMHFAFDNCKNLTQAPDIPDSVTDLSYAFSGCESLSQAPRLGNHVENMNNAFKGCDNLVEAPEIPSSVRDLSCAFMSCDSLVRAPVIPEGVRDMSHTFSGCISLVEASTIPSTVTTMGDTFDGCISLVNTPLILNGIDKLNGTFKGCTSLRVITNIPESVTMLSGTFSGCTALEDPPEIPESVTNMQGAFQNCTSLKRAPRIPERVTSLDSTFHGCTSLAQAPLIPVGVKNMNGTFQDCVNITVAPELPETVQSMSSTFRGCTSLTTAPVIPASVTNMNYTFVGCIQLTGMIEVNGTPTFCNGCFTNTVLPITLFGTCEKLAELAATATNGNVTVAFEE